MKKLSYTKPKIYPANLDMKKTWFVGFRCTDYLAGVRKQFQYRDKINVFTTKVERIAAAKIIIKELTMLLDSGWNPFIKESEPMQRQEVRDIKSVVDECIAMKCATLKKFSQKTYIYVSKWFLVWLEKNRLDYIFPQHFTRAMAIQYMDSLALKGYSQKTYNNHLVTLRTIFNWMIDREIVQSNPFHKLQKQKEKQSAHASYTDEERDRLKSALLKENKRLYYACQFVYYCMLRRPELAAMKVGDIDLQNKTIKVDGRDAKNGRSETITIPRSFEPILYEMGIDKAPKEYYVFGTWLETCDVKLYKLDCFTKNHRKICDSLGIRRDVGFYSWKHTGVVALYKATKDIYAIMKQCRHTDISTTMIYMRSLGLVIDETVRNADFSF